MLFERKLSKLKYDMTSSSSRTHTRVIDDTAQLIQTRSHNIYNALCTSTRPRHRWWCLLRVCCRTIVLGRLSRETNIGFQWLPIAHNMMSDVHNTITDIIILSEVILQSNYWWNQIRFIGGDDNNNNKQKTIEKKTFKTADSI